MNWADREERASEVMPAVYAVLYGRATRSRAIDMIQGRMRHFATSGLEAVSP